MQTRQPGFGDASIQQPDPVIGTPAHDAGAWDGAQSYPDTCAIRSQEFILEQFTGQEIDEHTLVQEAVEHGWYQPGGGTSPLDVGNLLELHGLPVNRFENANLHTLTRELAQGHKVIIGVDSGELWNQNPIQEGIADALGFEAADHAVVVSGIDTSDPENIQVIISDPGTGDVAATYPLEQFLDAWADSGFFMVTTQDPVPATLPEMANFDYRLGHLPEVAGMPYNEFLEFEGNAAGWEETLHSYVEAHFIHEETVEHEDAFSIEPGGPEAEDDLGDDVDLSDEGPEAQDDADGGDFEPDDEFEL